MNSLDNLPLVSIIIPFYNVENYIHRCLDSIVGQTYRNIEIILVNDDSPDRSRTIVEQFALTDKRIEIIDRPNGGLSAARNTGLLRAKGRYVIFVDSDDWAEKTFVEKLVGSIIINDSEMACCRLRYVNTISNTSKVYGHPYKISFLDTQNEIIEDAIKVKNIHTPVWAKIYKLDFLRQKSLYFYEGIVNEDTLFTTLVALNANKVSFVDEVLFNSLERPGSISRSSQEKLFRDMHFVFKLLGEYTASHKIDPYLDNLLRSRYLRAMLYNLLQSVQRLSPEKYKEMHILCMNETLYKQYAQYARQLSLRHYIFYKISYYPNLFCSVFKIMRLLGFRMH